MATLSLITTSLGRAKILDADLQGLSVSITHVAAGSTGYTPADSATALLNEQERVAIASSEIDVPNLQLTLSAILEGAAQYWIREVGFFDVDGDLIWLWSHPTETLGYKSAPVRFLLGMTLTVVDVPLDAVTIVDQGQPLELSFSAIEARLDVLETDSAALEGRVATLEGYDLDARVAGLEPVTLYVDSIAGSNSNAGTSADAPFLTLDKALQVVDARAVTINLAADGAYSLHATQARVISDCSLTIQGTWDPRSSGLTQPVITQPGKLYGTQDSSVGLVAPNSKIWLRFVTWKTATSAGGTGEYTPQVGIVGQYGGGQTAIVVSNSTIEIRDLAFVNGELAGSLAMADVIVTRPTGAAPLIAAAITPLLVGVRDITLPVGLDLTDLISGLVRDAGGRALNVLANVEI